VTWSLKNWAEQARNAGAGPSGADAKPAATLAVLRDGEHGLETLLLKRSSKLAFHGGAWVFPGGRIDDGDWHEGDDLFRAAARAAVRETTEEAGIEVDVDTLVHLSNWTTPAISPKRFATWFFAAPAHAEIAEAVADGVESDAVRWFRPEEALAARAAGEIELAPPQYVTLLWLGTFADVATALAGIGAATPVDFTPQFHFLERDADGGGGGAICVYDGDVAWDALERVDEPGPRHRLVMPVGSDWVYERD
jgi:8-oxo-dGTP pyrophosphatase MutT (NUDIX family)